MKRIAMLSALCLALAATPALAAEGPSMQEAVKDMQETSQQRAQEQKEKAQEKRQAILEKVKQAQHHSEQAAAGHGHGGHGQKSQDQKQQQAASEAQPQKKAADKAQEAQQTDKAWTTSIVVIELDNRFGAVRFNHHNHARMMHCTHCHAEGQPQKPELTRLEYHDLCKGCHQQSGNGPVKCRDCHQRQDD